MIQRIKALLQGKKNQRSFKIIICDKSKPYSGKLEIIGHINKITNECKINWLKLWSKIDCGAKINKTVYNMLREVSNKNAFNLEFKTEIDKINYNKHVE